MTAWDPLLVPVSYFTVGSVASPGVTEPPTGDGLTFDWETKKGPGTSGATSKYNGQDLAKWSTKTLLWESAHFEAWAAFVAPLQQEPSGAAFKAFDFWHPLTSAVGITSAKVLKIGFLTPEDDTGLYSVTIEWEQHRAPKPSAAKADGSKSQQKTEEEDPIEKLIAAKTAEYQSLAEEADGA
jgi:hypothetical protein